MVNPTFASSIDCQTSDSIKYFNDQILTPVQSKYLSCKQLKDIKKSLSQIKNIQDFSSKNPAVKEASAALTNLFEKTLSVTSTEESNALMSIIRNCLTDDVSAIRIKHAKSFLTSNKIRNEEFEKESFSPVELICAGFSVKEILGVASAKAAASATSTGAAALGATATSVAAAVVGGWAIGEAVFILDSQTGNHFRTNFSKWLIDPVVSRSIDKPSDAQVIKSESKKLASNFLVTYKNSRFKKIDLIQGCVLYLYPTISEH
jgi:hypothetical protein